MVEVIEKGRQFFHLVDTAINKVLGFATSAEAANDKARHLEQNSFVCRTHIDGRDIVGWGPTRAKAWEDCINNVDIHVKNLQAKRGEIH